jgi:hypothetical protein
MAGRSWRWLALGTALACGDLASEPDGGNDAGPDVAKVDASIADAGFDATVDVSADVVVDSGKDSSKTPGDAPYVDFDAASAPWSATFGVGAS